MELLDYRTTSQPSCPNPLHSFDFDGECFLKSKTEKEQEIFKRFTIYTKDSSNDTSSQTKGQGLVDRVAAICNADSIENLIAIARKWISKPIAERLAELHSLPLFEDELPLSIHSAKSMLKYCFDKGINNSTITATPTGELQVDWENEHDERIVIRFFIEEKIWVTYRTKEVTGTVQTRLTALTSKHSPIKFPEWAYE